MASRSRKGKNKGLFHSIAAVVIIGTFIISFFGIPSRPNVRDLPEMLVSKSETLKAWFQNCVPKAIEGDWRYCNLSNNVGSGGSPIDTDVNADQSNEQLQALTQAEPEQVPYNREEWNHWISQGSGCWDTRDQVLYDEAKKDESLVLADKDGKTVTDVSKACSVKSGTWVDPYTGSTINNPKELDIDHMIPLGYAASHGGQAWDKEKKEQYANDLSYPGHLIAVKASENRAKSDRGPAEWKPSNQAYWCQYAADWIVISHNYKLTVSPSDAAALTEMLGTCGK